ncbi:MAG TPA: winged helix-turn-helix domain-containing protein [Rhizomicrobium sp.]|nr:winged helix-turn-helix domain-containing protein [Rhizomicrobium sp.]
MGAQPYRFGRFTLDPANWQLSAEGAPVALGPTDFRILMTLVERAGSLVSKEELMTRVWGRSIVGDNTLQVHITALRKALGEGFITTRHGHGYSFVKQVSRPEDEQPGNLPSYFARRAHGAPSRLIGRDTELRILSELMLQNSLVTLVGPGGVGKTRLALQAANESANRFKGGAWLVELASLTEGTATAGAVATALGIQIGEGAAPVDTLARRLAGRNLLVVLDNCEHMVASCAPLCEALLAVAPGVRIIATSREPLSCLGEQIFEVPPLALPDEDTNLAARESAAVELFAERARSLNPEFQLSDDDAAIAARLCRHVDGLPLAIEMVASWAGMLGLKALEEKLDGSFNGWLGARRTGPARHSTLSATLEWSHDLLSPAEQVVLRRLAVFAGAFSMAAAESIVADGDIPKAEVFGHIGRLINKSMVAVVPGSREHCCRLLETTRAFMLEKLAASPDAEFARQRHADHVLHTLRHAGVDWETMSDTVFLERYGPVLDDLRSALEWSMSRGTDNAVALAASSWPLWRDLNARAEGRHWLIAAASLLTPDTPPALEAQLRRGLGAMYFNTAAVKSARAELDRAVTLFRSLGDTAQLGSALAAFAHASLMLGNVEDASSAIAEALPLVEGARRPKSLAAAYMVKFFEEARRRSPTVREAGRKAIHLCEVVGAERSALVVSSNLVEAMMEMGDFDEAIASGEALIARLRGTSHTDIFSNVLALVAVGLTLKGDADRALPAAEEAVPLLRDQGMLFWFFDHLALRAGLAGRTKDAALISGYADALSREFGRPRDPIGREAVGRLAALLKETFSEQEIEQFARIGAQLSEAQVLNLALG